MSPGHFKRERTYQLLELLFVLLVVQFALQSVLLLVHHFDVLQDELFDHDAQVSDWVQGTFDVSYVGVLEDPW